jgi:uncharacterized protein (DUF697 family)
MMGTMKTCKQEALGWVHRFAAGGAAVAMIPLPLSSTACLAALETYMMNVIGEIYGSPPGAVASVVAGGTFVFGGSVLKRAAINLVGFVPIWGWAVRAGIAASAIEALGRAIVGHYEKKYPDKQFAGDPPKPEG